MKKLRSILSVLVLVFIGLNANAQKLPKFKSSIKKKVGPTEIAVPYTDVNTYLGYAKQGNEDEVKEGKKFYYIYVWVPAVAPELGVRMMSPAGNGKYKNAVVSDAYTSNKSSKDFFDTYVTLEKSSILLQSKISEDAVKSATWTTLAKNDDSSEMPKDPKGRNYNSLLRYKSEAANPLKALTAGLYRIGFTTYKTGEVNGTFVAQVAAPVKLPGVGVAKTIDALLKQIK